MGIADKTCILCKKIFSGFGHNPDPLSTKGRCCNTCNSSVIVARIKQAYSI